MRRPKFSLRTLFVLVAIASVGAGWVAYQLNWIRERQSFRVSAPGSVIPDEYGEAKLPWPLRVFGERAAVIVQGVPEGHVSKAKALFPEAKVNPDIKQSGS